MMLHKILPLCLFCWCCLRPWADLQALEQFAKVHRKLEEITIILRHVVIATIKIRTFWKTLLNIEGLWYVKGEGVWRWCRLIVEWVCDCEFEWMKKRKEKKKNGKSEIRSLVQKFPRSIKCSKCVQSPNWALVWHILITHGSRKSLKSPTLRKLRTMTEKYILQFSYTVYSSRVIAGPFASQIRPEQRVLLVADVTGWGAAMLAAVDGSCK